MNSGAPARRPGPGFLAAAAAAVAVLCGLGVWQVERLHWKRALIAERTARLDRPPVAVTGAAQAAGIDDLRPVRVAGTFLHGSELAVGPRVRQGRPGRKLVTPLRLAGGGVVLVDRGWVPKAPTAPVRRPAGTVTVSGIARVPGPKGWFAPDNDPAGGQWFRIAPREMAAALGLEGVLPWWLQAGAGAEADGWPAGDATVPMPPDNHLQYAITWFALALAAAVIAGIVWRRGRR